jgi:hypothetical protein
VINAVGCTLRDKCCGCREYRLFVDVTVGRAICERDSIDHRSLIVS